MEQKLALAVIKHKKVLIIKPSKSKKIWSLPTISINGESDEDCAIKLTEEVFSQPNIGEISYYMVFNEGNTITRIYFAEVDKIVNLFNLRGRWIKKNKSVNLTRLTEKVIKSLTDDGYL